MSISRDSGSICARNITVIDSGSNITVIETVIVVVSNARRSTGRGVNCGSNINSSNSSTGSSNSDISSISKVLFGICPLV
jgi:hypothetical protein